jgi:predicted RNA-binding Zn-ribbon protein involved in translation (DUF1610 family)
MSIEIVSPAEKSLAKCKSCGATLSYTSLDVDSTHGKDISGGPDGCEFIVCPSCGNNVVLRSW